MSTISTILSTLRSAVWAIDVRDEIANAIEQCYKDVNSPSLVTDGIEEVIGDMVDNGRISGAIVEDLGLITEGTSNLFDFTTVTAGRLNTSTGEVGEASGYWTSDFIPVENGKTYYFANTDRRVAYNSSKAYSANISGTTWTASANGYVRVSVTSANRKTAKINEGSAKDYRPGRSPIDFNLRDDVYRKAEVDAALAAVTIATDPELETAGAAADAKATGDAISALNESLQSDIAAKFLVVALFKKTVTVDTEGIAALNLLEDYWGTGQLATITTTLTNCSISNANTVAIVGGSYSATVTALVGYTLQSVTYTMSGRTVSAEGGVISIANVTGDITITATATEGPQIITDNLLYRWVGEDAEIAADGDYWYDRIANLGIIFHGTGVTSNGSAVCFDGTSRTYGQRLDGTGLNSTADYTLEMVFDNENTSSGLVASLNKSSDVGGTGLGLANGNMYEIIDKPYYPNTVTTGKQVVTVRSDENSAMVKNGTVLTGTGLNKYTMTGRGIRVGSRDEGSASLFIGKLYEIRVYAGTLTDAQIQHNHNIDISTYGIEV